MADLKLDMANKNNFINFEIVVARYNENVDWTYEFRFKFPRTFPDFKMRLFDLYLSIKGQVFPLQYSCKGQERKMRRSE